MYSAGRFTQQHINQRLGQEHLAFVRAGVSYCCNFNCTMPPPDQGTLFSRGCLDYYKHHLDSTAVSKSTPGLFLFPVPLFFTIICVAPGLTRPLPIVTTCGEGVIGKLNHCTELTTEEIQIGAVTAPSEMSSTAFSKFLATGQQQFLIVVKLHLL